MAGLSFQRTLTTSDVVGGNGAVGNFIGINCAVAGNVSLETPGGTYVIAVATGMSFFPIAVIRVNTTGTTATATYANLT